MNGGHFSGSINTGSWYTEVVASDFHTRENTNTANGTKSYKIVRLDGSELRGYETRAEAERDAALIAGSKVMLDN